VLVPPDNTIPPPNSSIDILGVSASKQNVRDINWTPVALKLWVLKWFYRNSFRLRIQEFKNSTKVKL